MDNLYWLLLTVIVLIPIIRAGATRAIWWYKFVAEWRKKKKKEGKREWQLPRVSSIRRYFLGNGRKVIYHLNRDTQPKSPLAMEHVILRFETNWTNFPVLFAKLILWKAYCLAKRISLKIFFDNGCKQYYRYCTVSRKSIYTIYLISRTAEISE